MDEQDRGFGGGGTAVQELVFLQRRQEEEVRRQMFGPVDGVAFPAAGLGQQQVDYGELGGFCESETGGSSEPETMAPARPCGGSGSKRSRAAEVHNLSEKRRRSRINEKMKALQSLIPNSNKTDKASMLDEAIEYLKQLQLQVQMLSMRNGVYLSPSCLSGALEPVQASQMFAALGGSYVTASNSGAVMPPVNQSSEHPFHLELSQSHLRSFQLHESSEMMFRGEIMPKHHLTSTHERANLPGNEMNSIRQEPPMLNTDHFDGCSHSKEQSQDTVPKNTRHA